MANLRSKTMAVLAMALAGTLLATPALADKPAHAGGGKPDRQQAGPGERGQGAKADRRDEGRKNNQQRVDQRDGDRRDARGDNRDRDGDRDRNQRHDRDRDGLPMLSFDIDMLDNDLADVEITVEFVEPQYLAEDPDGEIEAFGQTWSFIPFDLWVAEEGEVGSDGR